MSKFYFTLAAFCFSFVTVTAQQPVTDSLHRVLKVTQTDSSRVNLYNALAKAYRENHPDSTQLYACQAGKLATKISYSFGIAASHLNSGNAAIIRSDYKAARQYFLQAKNELQVLQQRPEGILLQRIQNELARAHASLGVVYSEENNYPPALESYFAALKIYKQTGQKASVSKAYNNIGIIYKSQAQPQKALDYFQKALEIQQQTGEQSTPVTLTNIGTIYLERGQLEQAKAYFEKARASFRHIDNQRGFALLLNQLGDYYQKTGNTTQATSHYKQSLANYTQLGNDFGKALVLYQLGALYFGLEQYADALAMTTQSLDLAQTIGTLDQIKASEKLLSDLYDATGNQKLALFHFRAYAKIKDSLDNQENVRKFLRTEMAFEYEKKAALYDEQNKRRHQLMWFAFIGGLLLLLVVFLIYNRLHIKRRLTLQKEVAEYEQKALHLQMNPHFVFNCLSSISSFIVQNGTDSAIKYLSKFSKLMRLTLEYSKSALIPLDKEIEGLQNYLELEQLRFNKKFDFTISTSPDIEDDMALPPLLIQPFVENAILHGMVPKESNGNIDIHFEIKQEQLLCTIWDDGIGFKASRALKENSVTAHESMALEITKKRLEMMEATMTQSATVTIEEVTDDAQKPTGTKVILALPILYTSDLKTRT